MKIILPVALGLVVLMSLLSACGGDSPVLEIKLAPIHEVQISVAETFPEQIFVHITGGLADSCTSFHDLNTERSGNTIEIEVTTERPRDAVCAQVYSYFEENINLGSDFTSGQTYTVDVNGFIKTFVYP